MTTNMINNPLPDNIIFVRHGLSEANRMQASDRNGDGTLHDLIGHTIPDRQWRLEPIGALQAQATGRWIAEQNFIPDRAIVSPFVRTRETAANLFVNQPKYDDVLWEENRSVRERSWGEIDSLRKAQFKALYPMSWILKEKDPLYWAPPGGESIAQVAETRARALLNNLRRESFNQDVLVVTHGEFIQASMTFIEQISDEEFERREHDDTFKVHNCMAVHYSSIDPETGEKYQDLHWVRKAYPVLDEETQKMVMIETDWEYFSRPKSTSADLLKIAESVPRRLPSE